MNVQLDQAISTAITETLRRSQLSPEMLRMIKSSLNTDNKTGELFKWAHLTLLNCECVSGENNVGLSGAIAMEFFALAADIFDDIQDQDNDDLPWRKIPNANSINLATCLLMLAYESIAPIPDSRLFRDVIEILSQTGISASDGQFSEFLYDSYEEVTLEQYFEIVKRKSGSLTACACKIGATLGGASEALVLQFDEFGTNLGIMSQIRNDLNDFLDFGKKNDFVNNRKTLPYVYLLNILRGNPADRFKELIQREGKELDRFGSEKQDYLRQLTFNEGAVHYCKVMYELFRQKAMEIIKTMPIPENHKEKMIKIC